MILLVSFFRECNSSFNIWICLKDLNSDSYQMISLLNSDLAQSRAFLSISVTRAAKLTGIQ